MPREGHDTSPSLSPRTWTTFLSTCPVRGTTPELKAILADRELISIHVPREGHDDQLAGIQAVLDISIHVPREGHDRRAVRAAGGGDISIHVPREGHDLNLCGASHYPMTISIHVPREGHDCSTC